MAVSSTIRWTDEKMTRHSHRRMRRRWRPQVRGLVLPRGVTRIQLNMLADIQGCEEAQQQDKRQGDGVRVPASAMDADAPQREDGGKNEGDECVARHQ